MDTSKLKSFAQAARRHLMEQVAARLEYVLSSDSVEIREKEKAVKELRKQIDMASKEAVIERVAYTWFNRFCALRFMDVNGYTRIGTVSPAEGFTQPEILAEAKQGHISDEFGSEKLRQKILDLLGGRTPSSNSQQEAYRLLLVAVCNYYNTIMPFMFEKIADYTELLMPDDLISEGSILHAIRKAMTPDACEDVEVIGWLYQFYISEKKDEVFDGLKKNKKITPENIPAATQLFTPHWIVRYLVENSLGRLWLLNRPGSKLIEQMDYYIKPEQAESDFLRISKPEEIKICDPACGSGHMLTYAFDLLYAIYEEEGYEPAEIPEKILTNNLYGIEIDERAGELAAFALTMKARAKQRRFFNRKAASGEPVEPNICVLENVHFDGNELKDYMDFVGRDLFTAPLQTTLRQFEEADNFGSLIRPDVTDVDGMLRILESKNLSGQLFISMTHQKVLQALRQADYLSPKYHVVIANPPYMRIGSMNPILRDFAQAQYSISKPDLYSMFIERNLEFAIPAGFVAMITMQSWMFLTSFEKLRKFLLSEKTIESMAHLGTRAFDTIGGEVVSTTAFVLQNELNPNRAGAYIRLTEGSSEAEKQEDMRQSITAPYLISGKELLKIPACPVAYWLSEGARNAFVGKRLDQILLSEGAVKTGNNSLYLRQHWEVARVNISILGKWRMHPKGGEFRKWYGNVEWVVDWSAKARKHYKDDFIARIPIEDIWDIPGITWTSVASEKPSFRILTEDEIANNSALFVYPRKQQDLVGVLCCLNSKPSRLFLNILNPTIQYLVGDVMNTPLANIDYSSEKLTRDGQHIISIEKSDWDSYETSWDFTNLPLLNPDYRQSTLKATYQKLRTHWREMTLEMQRLEEENNHIFIDAYGLQDELTPEVPLNEITLTCNPHYRYGNDKSEKDLESLLLADTMRELISYAVGCMFGRYALDKPGLILANQGETIEDYLKRVPSPTFRPDDDNVIPIMETDWFTDDIAERFKKFLRVTFGDDHYEENLAFIEEAIGKDIRRYFIKDFYNDHIRRYKKRPIYWLFSSPQGSFNALIYMHRYRPDTVSVILNDYLRDFRSKLTARRDHLEKTGISASASQREKTAAVKEIEKLKKMISEINTYEHEILYPLATRKIEIDLDDGVKVNYPKFGKALRKIAGLEED